jgi:hypothetical protein
MPRHVREATKRAAARQAARRMIARGERPGYRLRAQGGHWTVDALPWITVTAAYRWDAIQAARAAIAAWLEVTIDSFDVDA